MAHPVSMHGICYDANSSFMTGAAMAPAEIRKAIFSPSANMSTELGLDLSQADQWHDAGNLQIAEWPATEANVAIRGATEKLIGLGHRVLTFGGDHSIAYPVIAAHNEAYPELTVLQIDAHADLHDSFDDNPFSHASPFARLMEQGLVKRLVQVGVRTLTPHQREQIARFGVETHEMKDWEGALGLAVTGPLYISLDLDALDPAFAPGVSHHEPGGLSTREVLQMIHRVPGTLVGAEIVELNPRRDVSDMTAMVAGRLAKELLARLLTGVMQA